MGLLTSFGISAENARDWVGNGCSQANSADQRTEMVPTYMNIALPVDLVLHNGIANVTGKRVGIETGDPREFRSFDDFYEAFKKQTEHMMRGCLWHANIAEMVKGRHWRMPAGVPKRSYNARRERHTSDQPQRL